jgi:hypothetical protein
MGSDVGLAAYVVAAWLLGDELEQGARVLGGRGRRASVASARTLRHTPAAT